MPAPTISRAVDAALEALVVPSFSRLGPAIRRRTAGWEDAAAGSLDGRIVVVTGATSGLGASIAGSVAALGATTVVVGRDGARGASVVDRIERSGGRASFHATDLSDLDQVRALADRLGDLASSEPLHAIVHNAGALLGERRVGPSGLEVTWATMVVAPHLLTRLLAPRLDRAIWMSSGGMYLQDLDLDDWSWERRPWDGTRAYAQAKRAQIDLVAEATARGEAPLQVAMHPGWADTPGVTDSLPGFARIMGPLLRSAEEGADTAVWLATAPADRLVGGAFYLDRRPRSTVRWPGTQTSDADRRRLRALVDEQSGAPLSDPPGKIGG